MYDDFFEIRLTNKEILTGVLAVLVVLVVTFSAGYLLGVERTKDIYDNGGGAAGTGQQIQQAGADIGHATDGIKEAEGTADQIGAGLAGAKESAGYIHSTASDSAGIVAECQSILEGIRRRGATDKVAH